MRDRIRLGPYVVFGMLMLVAVRSASAQRPGAIGYVIDAVTLAPIANATITVTPQDGSAKQILTSATSMNDGQFELAGLGTGAMVTVRAPGYAAKRLRQSTFDTQPVRVTLERGAAVTITVRDETGAAVPSIVALDIWHP